MKKLHFLVSSALVVLAFLPHQKVWSMEEPLTPTKTMASPSVLSSLQNVANNAADWMWESALQGCDRFGRWVGSYAQDLPPVYFAKSFLEVDYVHDDLFWQGYFYQELGDLKQVRFPGSQERERLKELQGIVGNGLLSPYAYEEGLKELGKKRSFTSWVQDARDAFQSELKENQDIVLQHLRKDLLNSLEGMQNDGEGINDTSLADFKKKLAWYRNVLNAFDYAETLASLCIGMEENKGKLALSETQYKSFMEPLTDALHKINKKQYFQIKAEYDFNQSAQGDEDTLQDQKLASAKAGDTDVFSKFLEEGNANTSFFSYPLSFAKGAADLVNQGISFALENPMQAITMGLAFQAAAVAAHSSFALPRQSESTKGGFRFGARFLNGEKREDANRHNQSQKISNRSNVIDLASLNATQGVIIQGAVKGDCSGISVNSAGDFNGDGINDVIVGAYEASSKGRFLSGNSYVIYGQKGGYLAPIDLASLNATQGVIIQGAAAGDYSGIYVSSAGDFNSDGINDVIVGAVRASPKGRQEAGNSYIVYGQKSGYLAPIDLASLNATQGVIIQGAAAGDNSGWFVSSAGDFNSDGINDVIVGAWHASPQSRQYAGSSYVIYGRKGGYLAPIDLASLNATQGVIIQGAAAGDNSGFSLSSIGDFNGDGINDLIVGAWHASPQGRQYAGSGYVIYGRKGGYLAPIDLASLKSTQGVIIQGAAGGDCSGVSVSSAGDFNGDGINDLIAGAYQASSKGRQKAGNSYVIYGQKGGTYLTPIDLASLNATQGVIIEGAVAGDYSGTSVSSAGDFNGDGINDVIVGASTASPQGHYHAGSSYVIYGRKGGYLAPIDLASLNATQGVIIQGAAAGDNSGVCVSSAEDFNGDGLSDVIVGAWHASPQGHQKAGSSYVIYGKNVVEKNNVQKNGQ